MGKPRKEPEKVKGVYEREPGSGVWWIRYADTSGKIRREKAGMKGVALKLIDKRHAEVLKGRKLPETLRKPAVTFSSICDDAIKYSKVNKLSHKQDEYRIAPLKQKFGSRTADGITPQELSDWLAEQVSENEWKPATANRMKALMSLVFRLALENGKVPSNPARLVKRRREDNGRIRFLNQYKPTETKLDYLKAHADEESRLRAVIEKNYAEHLSEFLIALHSGMRPSEQYGLTWDRVDLVRKLVTIPKSKNGTMRHIPLNSVALATFQQLFERSKGEGPVFIAQDGAPLQGYKHWFEDAVSEAGIGEFTWYCLRHTFASRLVMAGVDIRTVAELMGHKTIQMTMRYAHLAPAHKLAAVERLAGKQPEPTGDGEGKAEGEQQKEATDTRTGTCDLEAATPATNQPQ